MAWIGDFYGAQPFWVWAALAAGLLAVEVVTGSGWLLWAAASAAVTGVVAALFGPPLAVALLVYAVLTIASTLLARRYLPSNVPAHAGDINDNIARLVGHHGSAAQAFVRGAGRVFIDGKEWAAELDDGEALEAGAEIQVTGVEGARLKVRRA
ncbi:MAG: NfeD family protein [Phenylobacterium sp.]|uniref:NfeD family protein n=1 Tax=Phenylobacterium sp. TaxID=1871053 RepID=UPI0025DD8E1C|nr:NfeD family protein [Phenylobacterium sp.]MBI1200025.1 NfeD family protein [Phenylobacterium sp.]